MRPLLRPALVVLVCTSVGALGAMACQFDRITDVPSPDAFGPDAPYEPEGGSPGPDAEAPPPAAGDTPDPACPITSGAEWKVTSPAVVRSLLVHDTVYVVEDHVAPTIPLRTFALATGAEGPTTDVERPATGADTHFPRLQRVSLAGKDELFVSYLRRVYAGQDGGLVEGRGGIVHAGELGQPLPANAALIADVDDSVDGVWPVDLSSPAASQVMNVLSWPLLDAGAARLRVAGQAADGGWAFGNDRPVDFAPVPFERAGGVMYRQVLEGLVRSNDDGQAQTWSAANVAGFAQNGPLPGKVVTWTPLSWRDSSDDLNMATYFGVSPEGVVTRYTPSLPDALQKRDLTVLPAGFSAAASNAKMVHTNGTNGSLVFPGFKNGAPRLFRIHIYSGRLDEWPETAADMPDGAFGWSALHADKGVVCYANSANVVRCGCMDKVFSPVL